MCGFHWLCTNSPTKSRILSPPPIWSPPPPPYIIVTNTDASEYDRRYHRRHRILSPPFPTPPYIISTTSDASVYYCRHFWRLRILSPPPFLYIIATTSGTSVYCLRISPTYIIATTTDTSVHILSSLPPTPSPHRIVDCAGVPSLPPNPVRHRRVFYCAVVWNLFQGRWKREVLVVHQYVETDTTSNYKWGSFSNLPAIVSKKCTGIGVAASLDGGAVCYTCLLIRV